MRYLSICSGIEAATTAWHPLGWTPVAFSEIEPFPSAVLSHHYPATPNLGDMTNHHEWSDTLRPALIVGGTPCQAFSVAGLRKGLDDPRGNLTLVFLGILAQFRPRWVVWENVPGVLSDQTRAFGAFLGGLGELGYGFAYRIFDAQYFGVPQRRRRVFVVGCLGDWKRAAAVLFEPESLRWDSPPSRKAGESVAVCPTLRAGGNSTGGDRPPGTDVDTVESLQVARSLNAHANRCDGESETFILAAHSLRTGAAVRRLTPRECERLQGFPDGYTAIPWRGKPADQCPDGPRYKALGNSMAVPVMHWIGKRIDSLTKRP